MFSPSNEAYHSKNGKVVVELLQGVSAPGGVGSAMCSYKAGEIAGFKPDVSDDLVRRGIARYLAPSKETKVK